MSHGLLPARSEVSFEPSEDYTLRIDDDDAGAVFDALAVGTRREILRHLSADPTTASRLASAVDTSVQNVTHHLETLEEAGLVRVVDTWYSSRGREMAVYAPSARALVVDCAAPADHDR
jgi:predicted transcriptional regulator